VLGSNEATNKALDGGFGGYDSQSITPTPTVRLKEGYQRHEVVMVDHPEIVIGGMSRII
jgi:hypothetical protein